MERHSRKTLVEVLERKGAARVLLGMMREGECNMSRFHELSGLSSFQAAADLRDVLLAVRLVEKEEFRESGRLNLRLNLTNEGASIARLLDQADSILGTLPSVPRNAPRGIPRARLLQDGRDTPRRPPRDVEKTNG